MFCQKSQCGMMSHYNFGAFMNYDVSEKVKELDGRISHMWRYL